MKKLSITIIASALMLAGCGSPEEKTAVKAPSATPVTVVQAVEYTHAPVTYYVGQVKAIESAKLTPRTTGYLVKKHFDDGAMVTKGDVLFDVDPTSYQAALDAAKATLQEAQSALELTKLNHARSKKMMATGGISQAQLDVSNAELKMAQSRVISAKSNVVVQQDNLNQTKVRAPYSGRIGKSKFSIGDMVGPNFGAITDIVQISPIDASFSLKESELEKFDLHGAERPVVTLELDGKPLDKVGSVTFVDNKINPTSGTLSIAATFENTNETLTPNQFVRVGISPATPFEGVSVPHKSIHQDHASQYVMTIENGRATRRDVTVSERIGKNVFVMGGINAGETVIVGGLQRIRAGAPVVAAE